MKQYDPDDYFPYYKRGGRWRTILHIHGAGLDREAISQRLVLEHSEDTPLSLFLEGNPKEWHESGIAAAVHIFRKRINDPRLLASQKGESNFWAHGLTANQYESTHEFLERHLELWLDLLFRNRSAFLEFQQQGYWSVIDCIALHEPTYGPVQFRLPTALMSKLGRLGVDIDFTIVDFDQMMRALEKDREQFNPL